MPSLESVEGWRWRIYLSFVRGIAGPTEIALSVVSVMELEHGIWRAKDETRARKRRQFLEDLIVSVPVYAVTVELARRAGQIDGEQQEKGVCIACQDLPIGVSALELGYSIATQNLRHFRLIPGLNVLQI